MFVGATAPDREPLACRGRLRVRKDPAAYVAALGQPDLLAEHWQEVVALARRPADETHFHVFVMHYPRPELPGRCVTLHVTFSNVRDPAFHAKRPAAPRRGLLFSIRKTYRLDGDAPRLIEAAIEAHDARPGRALVPAGHLLHDTLGDVARDDEAMAHYADLGGGRRTGYAWTEKAAVAYEIERIHAVNPIADFETADIFSDGPYGS